MSDRRTVVETAQPWLNEAMNPEANWSDRYMGAINAYNHTENALFALAEKVVSCSGGAGDSELLEMAKRYAPKRS